MTLRQRITIEQRSETRDGDGDPVVTWTTFAADVPASFLPGPGREYLASEAVRASVSGRFVIRYLSGLTAAMRVKWDGQVWNIAAPPLLDVTGRREMTLMVSEGANDG